MASARAAALKVTFFGTQLESEEVSTMSQQQGEARSFTHPTLTQVPPRRLFSTTMALTPNLALAIRADPKPPLPPPSTR